MAQTNDDGVESVDKRIAKLQTEVETIKTTLEGGEITSWYHFRFALSFAVIVIAAGIIYVSPVIIIGGLTTNILAFVVFALGMTMMFMANFKYKPQDFRKKIAIAGTIVMLMGILLLVVMSFTNITQTPLIKLSGLLVFSVGLMVMSLSRRYEDKKSAK